MHSDYVKKHVQMWASQPFEWATHNCALAVKGYVEDVTQKTFPHDFGGYDKAEAHDWLERKGGLIRLARSFAGFFGMIETGAPDEGDIGVFRAVDIALCGICVGGGRWAYVTERGVAVSPVHQIVAWKII